MTEKISISADVEFYKRLKKIQRDFEKKTGVRLSQRKITKIIARSKIKTPSLNVYKKVRKKRKHS